MKIYDCVVIGAGNRGNVYSRHSQMNPIAVIDPKPSHLKSFSELYKIPEKSRFTNLKNLPIADSAETFCLIMTPDVHHVVAAREAVSKGYKMILMEKPMATNLNDCQELVELFERKKVTVGVCHVLRGSFANQTIKELLEKGKLGQVHMLEERFLMVIVDF